MKTTKTSWIIKAVARCAMTMYLAVPVVAISCGNALTTPCLADTDIRYDASASNAVQDQAPIWKQFEGLYMLNIQQYGGDGKPSPQNFADPNGLFPFAGNPYEQFDVVGFQNVTMVGSRMYLHRYLVFPSAPLEFCEQEVPEGAVNVLNGECGVNGYTSVFDIFGTTTYHKDGGLQLLRPFLPLPDASDTVPKSKFTPVDKDTWYASSPAGDLFVSESFVCLRPDCARAASSLELYLGGDNPEPRLMGYDRYRYTKVDTATEWVQAIDDAHTVNGILPEQQAIPMTDCLLGNCPTEEEFCEQDPNCSVSPFQEPAAQVQGGAIAGFTILGVFLLVGCLFLLHRYRMAQQVDRYRTRFASRVATNMSLKQSIWQLPPSALAAEFARIDGEDTADGKISKEDLWAFVSTGKAGEMSPADFNALFAAMDIDGNGTVDFTEFCTFMGQCHSEFRQVRKNRGQRNRSEIHDMASRRISAILVPLDPKDVEEGSHEDKGDAVDSPSS